MEILSAGPEGLRRAAGLIKRGDVIAFPTETVYGLAARAADAVAVERIYSLKGRPREKPLVLMLPDARLAARWAEVTPTAARMMERWWPGPLTLVVPARPGIADGLVAGEPPRIGIRVPDHPVARRLLLEVGEPLATTSANESGKPPATTAAEAATVAGVAAVVDGGRAPGGVASSVCDVSGPFPRVLREGAVPTAALLAG